MTVDKAPKVEGESLISKMISGAGANTAPSVVDGWPIKVSTSLGFGSGNAPLTPSFLSRVAAGFRLSVECKGETNFNSANSGKRAPPKHTHIDDGDDGGGGSSETYFDGDACNRSSKDADATA